MSKLAHSNQETMDEIERRSEIEGDYIASIEGPHEDKPPAHPSLEELDKCIAINEAFKARKNADVIINPDRATDIELYCLHAVRDGLATAPKLVAETLLNKHFSQAHTDMVGDAEYREGYIKGIHDLVSALLIGAPQSPWMDIETAPKDGTEILGLFFHPRDEDSYPMLSGPWTTCFKDGKWRSSWDGEQVLEYMSDFGSEYKSLFYDPTHWMPLPEFIPDAKAFHNYGEGDPSVMPDRSGGDV